MQDYIKNIFEELDFVLSKIDEQECASAIDTILKAKKIVWIGAGRVWMTVKAFTMRLWHLGMNAWFLWDATVPWITQWDLLIVASGSGETKTILDLVVIAKKNGATILLITGNKDSSMWKLADKIIEIKAPSKTKSINGFTSVQPMTTLNEQSLFLFFDALTLEIMHKMNETHDTMWARHSNLE